ncbi:MAG TPA: serine hydrolase [Candidatus Saccharimonadales bacterium]
MRDRLSGFAQQLRLHWKRILVYGLSSVAILTIVIQLLYPHDQLLPYARIDGVSVGGWQKADAAWELDHQYLIKRARIYFGTNSVPYRSPTINEMGVSVKNTDRVAAVEYAWWLRLLPSSLIWAQAFSSVPEPDYDVNQKVLDSYIKKELGDSCNVTPKDATITFEDGGLHAVRSEVGGTCQMNDVRIALQKLKPVLRYEPAVRIPMNETQPAVATEAAETLVGSLTSRIGSGVSITVGNEAVAIPGDQVMSWLDFSTQDGKLTASLSSERANEFMAKNIAPKVAVAAGVTKVSTYDFVETSRQNGPSGQALDIDKTLGMVMSYLMFERDSAAVVTNVTNPRIEYVRNYSATDAGFSALFANFAKDHPGSFGISLIELSGSHRRATYNDTKTFVTASTYKLFVAYSTLRRIDAGTMSWGDANISAGRNLEKCFDDMIVKSDNACAEALLQKIGPKAITDEVREIGLTNTSFIIGNTPQSTAGDEALFLAQLESSQLPISADGRARLIEAMKRNIYRKGIPAGTSGQVADKVGFLWGLLHDASIVYIPTGTYVLVIMTDGSSWGAIADLTRQIESLRAS